MRQQVTLQRGRDTRRHNSLHVILKNPLHVGSPKRGNDITQMTVRGTLSAKSQWEGDLECFTEPTYAHQNQSSHQGGVVWLKKVLLEVHPESSRWNEDYSSKPSAWTGQPNRHGFKSQFCHLPVLASSWPLWSFFSQAQNRHNIIRGLPKTFVRIK